MSGLKYLVNVIIINRWRKTISRDQNDKKNMMLTRVGISYNLWKALCLYDSKLISCSKWQMAKQVIVS